MGIFEIISVILAIAGIAGSIGTSIANKKSVDSTNDTNMQIAQDANAAQAAESAKAYERSKASNQVNLMMQAGMSRAGAINALNGGGSYTPAPVNTAQMQAPQYDDSGVQSSLSGLMGAFTNSRQMKQAQEQFEKSYQQQEQVNSASIAKTNAETDVAKAQAAALERDNIMANIKNNPEKSAALGRLSSLVDATQYDSAFAYRQAVAEKAGKDDSWLNDKDIIDALNLDWNTANQGKNVSASTENIRAATKLTKQQVKTELERTGLTHQQAEAAAKEFVRLSQEIDEFMSLSAVDQRERAREYESQILRFARDVKLNERDISDLERRFDNTPGGMIANIWSYVVSRVVPLKGIVSVGK